MRAGWLAALVGVTLVGCGGETLRPVSKPVHIEAVAEAETAPAEQRATDRTMPDVQQADGFVLLKRTAFVYDAPARWATKSDVKHFYMPWYPHAWGGPRVARVVGRAGEFFAIASGGPIEGHCYRVPRGLFAAYDITIYVHRDDLFDVLTERHQHTFSDGNSVALTPGLALHEGFVAADPLRITMTLDQAKVGKVYRPDAQTAEPRTFSAEIHRETKVGAFEVRTEYVEVAKLDRVAGKQRIAVDGPCVVAELIASDEQLHALPENRTFTGMGSGCGAFSHRDYKVAPGAEAFWPDGRRAGHVPDHRVWVHASISRVHGERRCFKLHPTRRVTCGSENKFLELCFEHAAVSHIKAAP